MIKKNHLTQISLFTIIFILASSFISIKGLFCQEKVNVDSLIELATLETNHDSATSLYIKIANEFYYNQPDSAIKYCYLGLEHAHITTTIRDLSYFHNFIGVLYKNTNVYYSATYNLNKAIYYYDMDDFERGKASALNNLAQTWKLIGDYDKALNNYYESLEIFEKYQDTLFIAELHSNIGALLLEINDYEYAEEHFLISREQYAQVESQLQGAWISYDLGTLKLKNKKYKEAREYFEESEEVWIEKNRIKELNDTRLRLCELDIIEGYCSDLIPRLENCIRGFEKVNNQQGIAESYLFMGKAESCNNNYSNAIKYLLKSREIAERLCVERIRIPVYQELYNNYKLLGDYKNALIYQDKYILLKDSVFSADRHKLMIEYQTKLNLANKEYFIKQLEDSTKQQKVINDLILKENNTKQNSIYMLFGVLFVILILIYVIYRRNVKYTALNRELQESLKERETLIREVNHRVKNNLQIISSLLNLQAEQVIDKKESDILKISQSRVEAMSMIHENLYKSEKISDIDFSSYVNGLGSYMKTSFDLESKNIKLITDIPKITIDIDKLVPCGLIITELVTNSIKHAFDFNSDNKIEITCTQVENNVNITIHDNGKGIKPGFDFRKSESLGLRLVYGLARQIKSELKYENDSGLKVWFEFKID
ncbi:MAG: hypothetical protein C0596_09395 [Marinilabiliales bacterium]|nr:MAG: hypothetical protein C0596_09395 [Marinilabiliales bacterium]